VTYDYAENGGNEASLSEQYFAESEAVALTPTARKTGWTFVGWNTDQNAQTALSFLPMGAENLTLYAIFKRELAGTFIYHSNAVKQSTVSTVTIYNKETQATLQPPTAFGRSGWDFCGWATEQNADATSVRSLAVVENATFYALWSRTLTLSFQDDAAPAQTGTQYANSYNIAAAKNPAFLLPNAQDRNGMTFESWAAPGGKRHLAGEPISIAENTTLIPIWRENGDGGEDTKEGGEDTKEGGETTEGITFVVVFHANGGTGEPSPQTKLQGVPLRLSDSQPSREGYVFLGWATTPDATYTQYLPGYSYEEDANLVLYAVWHAQGEEPLEVKIIHTPDRNRIKYRGSFELEANQAVQFTATRYKEKAVVQLNPLGETKVQVTSVPRFFWKSAAVTVTAAALENTANSDAYTFAIQPTFAQYLIIILLFGWIWY
jgi:uncharacterized repeat protein (TIGR02543 family)